MKLKTSITIISGCLFIFLFIMLPIFLSIENKKDAPRALGINPYFIEEYRIASSIYPMKRISKIFGYLLEADKRSKGIDFDATNTEGILNDLVYKIFKNQ